MTTSTAAAAAGKKDLGQDLGSPGAAKSAHPHAQDETSEQNNQPRDAIKSIITNRRCGIEKRGKNWPHAKSSIILFGVARGVPGGDILWIGSPIEVAIVRLP